MDERTAETLCGELQRLVALGPGANDWALRRVREILDQFRGLGAYVDEKAAELLEEFEMWFTLRRWERYGRADEFSSRVHTSIAKLERAASTWLRLRGPG